MTPTMVRYGNPQWVRPRGEIDGSDLTASFF
jgi:hypothetical protein